MRVRLTTILILAALAATALPVAPAIASPPGCHVRNVTQRTRGTSFVAMVKAAHDGDRLSVRGTCRGGVSIARDLTIVGVGDPRPQLIGRGDHAILSVARAATVRLRHLVLAKGHSHEGGAIWNLGTMSVTDPILWHNDGYVGLFGGIAGGIWNGRGANLTLARTVVRDNAAVDGGGIVNDGSLTLTDSFVLHNSAVSGDGEGSGGGIINHGTARIVHSVVRGNWASFDGGGIINDGVMTLWRSVVQSNGAQEAAGGIENRGTLTLDHSVVRHNGSQYGVGGIENGGTLRLRHASLVRANRGDRGGIWNHRRGTVAVDARSRVTGNHPDDCYGTPAC